jgi:hypothetical protein
VEVLRNYAIDDCGVIHQIESNDFRYDYNYVMRAYQNVPSEAMSHLRLGYIIGSIGRIPTSLLDVGYGDGSFLKTARKIVPKVFGYDVEPAYPLDDIECLPSLLAREFDVVTFFDSLEHFKAIDFVNDLRTSYLCVSVPWCHYLSDAWFRNWKHRKPDEHLWHFNDDSLRRFMSRMGFELLNYCNMEDAIKKTGEDHPNILSAIFKSGRHRQNLDPLAI